MSAFLKFLLATKEIWSNLVQNEFKSVEKNLKFVIILGNQSADMDSIVGSMILAFIKTKLNSIAESSHCSSGEGSKVVYFPILNCNREILLSKFEVLKLFEDWNISMDDLIFFEQTVVRKTLETGE
jgi:hypothetical protein